ncbi:hypothetical protein PWP93_26965 [Paraburkholderia sp. A1RI-2L]|uniref:hypothetical protein n=1 Tax=Paraburkholderia sp. A1RI-2L TaxID=3028367 RepID=UPI003B775324
MDDHDDGMDEYEAPITLKAAIEENQLERASIAAELDEALGEIERSDAWLAVACDPDRYPEAFRLAVELFMASNPMSFDGAGGWTVPILAGESAASAIVAAHLQLGNKNNDGSVPVPFASTTRAEDERFKREERDSLIAARVDERIALGETREAAIWSVAESGEFNSEGLRNRQGVRPV